MIIVNGWNRLTILTKRSILDVAAVLDPLHLKTDYLRTIDIMIVRLRAPLEIESGQVESS